MGAPSPKSGSDPSIPSGGGGGGIPSPDELNDEEKEKLIQALSGQGFSPSVSDLENYLTSISPPGIRGASKHGKVPWAKDLFGKGTNPTEKITIKQESKRSSGDDLVMERWQRLAGLLKS